MQKILRGHFSTPLNREHFLQLCHGLANEHWCVEFDFNPRSIQRSEKVRLCTYLRETDCLIAINCQWHGRNAPSPTVAQIDDALASARVFHERINLFYVLVPGVVSDQLNNYISQINEEHKLNGLFTIHIWSWDDIEERLNICKQAAKKYLSDGIAMNPYWLAGAFEYDDRKATWPIRPSGKKDRNKPSLEGKSNAAFDRSVQDAFEQYVHSKQYHASSRYLRVKNAVNMGCAVALLHNNKQIELWLLTPEPRDTQFSATPERWVLYLMEHGVRHVFADVLFKNFLKKDSITVRIRFVQLMPLLAGGSTDFATHPISIERTWHQLYPNEPLVVKRHLLAEAKIEGDQVKVTHHVFAYGCELVHIYKFPLVGVSYGIVRHALTNRFYPKSVPHSHRVFLDGSQTYWRSIEENDKHTCNQDEQPPSPVERMKCQICSGLFFGYRNESRCSVCYVEQGIFGKASGAASSFSELFKNEIARPPVDF